MTSILLMLMMINTKSQQIASLQHQLCSKYTQDQRVRHMLPSVAAIILMMMNQ